MKSLVFVHGYLGGSAQWAGQVEAFSRYYNVVTVDLPGFGLHSDRESPESIAGYAEYVLGYLDSLGIEHFHLLGHSMGGMIVQEMMTMAAERVDHLVLYGTGPVGLLPGRFEPIAESKRKIIEDGPALTTPRIAAAWFMQREDSAAYQMCADLAKNVSLQAALAGLSAMEAWSGLAYLYSIECPTLILWGDGDRSYQWSQVEQLWQGIANAQLAVIPGTSHCVHLEKAHLFNAILLDYLPESASLGGVE